MPKTIELTVEIAVQRVSCPGVWLCQDGCVSLTMFALGTSYQTCILPPTFPLMFKDVFYFRKRFQESCALNNICCLLKGESIYCELLQWCESNGSGECEVLAQYLGALNDVLFPPNMCSHDGLDLLMRRSKDFPGILSPKIEIATKVRIDEVWNESALKVSPCYPEPRGEDCQQQLPQPACHSARYHRYTSYCAEVRKSVRIKKIRGGIVTLLCGYNKTMRMKCTKRRTPSASRSRSRPESTSSKTSCSMTPKNVERHSNCILPKSLDNSEELYACHLDDGSTPKTVIESRYIEHDQDSKYRPRRTRKHFLPKISPCICEICKRYHELFQMDNKIG